MTYGQVTYGQVISALTISGRRISWLKTSVPMKTFRQTIF
jgi:predicted metalloenzyme YecM